MDIKILSVLSFLIIFSSCKKNQESILIETDKVETQKITEKDISKLKYIEFVLDQNTETVIPDWREYYQLDEIVNNLKKADLSFFKENKEPIATLLRNLKSNIPFDVNSSATLARITALETKILKLESISNLATTSKKELLATIKDFLMAFSNLNFQMNKKIENDNIIIEKP